MAAEKVAVIEKTAQDITREDAQELTAQIVTAADNLWELVSRAYTERAWAALEYESWDDYVEGEFGSTRWRLPREERQEVVTSLRDAGLSVRAIASVTGDSKSTIGNVIRDAPVVDLADDIIEGEIVDPAPIPTIEDEVSKNGHVTTGVDGKKYPAKGTARPPDGKPPKPKPAPKPKPSHVLLSVSRPEDANINTFAHGAQAGWGDPELGAAVVDADQVQWFAAGSYDDITPGQARFLASCLLAAADFAEGI